MASLIFTRSHPLRAVRAGGVDHIVVGCCWEGESHFRALNLKAAIMGKLDAAKDSKPASGVKLVSRLFLDSTKIR